MDLTEFELFNDFLNGAPEHNRAWLVGREHLSHIRDHLADGFEAFVSYLLSLRMTRVARCDVVSTHWSAF